MYFTSFQDVDLENALFYVLFLIYHILIDCTVVRCTCTCTFTIPYKAICFFLSFYILPYVVCTDGRAASNPIDPCYKVAAMYY